MGKNNKFLLLYSAISLFLQLNASAMNDDNNNNFGNPINTAIKPYQDDKDPYQTIPVGSVLPFAGSKEPDGWLICDGTIVSRDKYKNLYNVIGRTYTPRVVVNQVSLGEDLFCLPDMRGRVPVGVDSDSRTNFITSNRVTLNNTLGASGGEEKNILKIDQTPIHDDRIHNKTNNNLNKISIFDTSSTASKPGNGHVEPHSNMQPYLILNYIIKY